MKDRSVVGSDVGNCSDNSMDATVDASKELPKSSYEVKLSVSTRLRSFGLKGKFPFIIGYLPSQRAHHRHSVRLPTPAVGQTFLLVLNRVVDDGVGGADVGGPLFGASDSGAEDMGASEEGASDEGKRGSGELFVGGVEVGNSVSGGDRNVEDDKNRLGNGHLIQALPALPPLPPLPPLPASPSVVLPPDPPQPPGPPLAAHRPEVADVMV